MREDQDSGATPTGALHASSKEYFGWLGVIRLGLVQTAIGAIVVLTTSTLNRVMVVELALPAFVPGALVGWHYAVQLSRPRWGYGADTGGARTPWIIGGVAALGVGAVAAALSTALMASSTLWGLVAGALSFFVIGVGVGASGTNLLALLAVKTAPSRKAAAAAIVWIMMIFGFVLTAGVGGQLLDPFSMTRLVTICAAVAAIATTVTILALWGIERRGRLQSATAALTPSNTATTTAASADMQQIGFRKAIAEIWDEKQARRFTIFIFVSMLAYSAQDLILEPFAGLLFDFSPGESTKLAGLQHGGVLLGMIATAIVGTTIGRSRARFMRVWTCAGCIASAAALAGLAAAALVGPPAPLRLNVFLLGAANGAFAVAAIGSMMTLASAGAPGREGTKMGLWGASQAIAFGVGGFLGAVAIDATRAFFGAPEPAFAMVFALEGAAFIAAAWLALRVGASSADGMRLPVMPAGDQLPAE